MIVPQMTPTQLRAATSNDQLSYIKAGPGSGKTFLASEAFGYLRLVRYRSDPRGIGGVTFARSARRELAGRVRRRWGTRATEWPNTISTFDELHRQILRYLCKRDLIAWPGGHLPERPEDSWAMNASATSKPGKKPRYRIGLRDDGQIGLIRTTSKITAPTPAFVDGAKLLDALKGGVCTHTDIRNVLRDAVDTARFPAFNEAIREFLASSYCHLIVDEAFDMNPLDIAIVEHAIDAGVSITVVGDPWQSLYEFRGSTPKRVDQMIQAHAFKQIDMPGEHRYESYEMAALAGQLFRNEAFQVSPPTEDDDFEVVLAHDWGTLWDEDRIAVLPAGKASKIDRGLMASCFVLLLNEVVQEQFGFEASGIGEARRALNSQDTGDRMGPVLAVLRDSSRSDQDVWHALREAFQPPDLKKPWPEPKTMARRYMERLISLVRQPGPVALGLSVHQAKGLEWGSVLFLDAELTTDSARANLLDIDRLSHRNVYVALTRAKSLVRVLRIAPDQWGVERSPIKHVPAG